MATRRAILCRAEKYIVPSERKRGSKWELEEERRELEGRHEGREKEKLMVRTERVKAQAENKT